MKRSPLPLVRHTRSARSGCSIPTGPGSGHSGAWTGSCHGDGKVITPLFHARPGETRVDPVTGEIRRLRNEPDAGLHYEGSTCP